MGEVPGLKRVRFTTSHPRDFGKEIVDAIDENPVLCNHVHLPVQSGSDDTLARMQRLYTRDEYMRRIEWMKRAARDISITTDIIVGFPGETEKDFEQTLELLREVEYESMFCFKYSPRPNTAAVSMADSIDDTEKGRRLTILLETQRAIQIRRNAEMIGLTEEVMVEGFNKATLLWIGRTSQHRMLNFSAAEGASLEIGSYRNVLVTRSGPNSLTGELVSGLRAG